MGILGWICFGFFAGLIARAVYPGNQRMGFLMTTGLGIGGAFVGGLLGSVIGGGAPFGELRPAGFIGAVIGALVLLGLRTFLARRP